MKVSPINPPLPGEHLAATWPTMRLDLEDTRPRTDPQWRQRMRFWAGRAATAEALERDQDNRAARLAWYGRATTAGVVSGLEVGFEPQASPVTLQVITVATRSEIPATGTSLVIAARLGDAWLYRVFDADQRKIRDVADSDITGHDDERTRLRDLLGGLGDPAVPTPAQRDDIFRDLSALLGYRLALAGHFVHVLPGHGITALGDDATVPRALRIDLAAIPVRELATGVTPWAAVLAVRPAEFGRFDQIDPTDPCELDPSLDAFADERRQDAAMLELIPLPVDWLARPALGDADDPRWRNRLANLVFADQAERAARQQIRFRAPLPAGQRGDTFLAAEDLPPWELEVVPLALLASERVAGAAERRFFLDRASVARRGGQAHARPHPAIRVGTAEALNPPGAGTPALWRARVEQFAEHYGALDPAIDIATQAASFQFLPPAGLLPKAALSFLTTADAQAIGAPDRAATSHFFPDAMTVEAVPVPVEDLDAALASSASLAPFDLAAATDDVVRVIVPVPQRVFDSRLLVIELEDPFFLQEIGRLVAERQDWRERRDYVQQRQLTLQQLASGPLPALTPPALENGQLEPEPEEARATNGFTAALVSPDAVSQPIELRVTFPARTVAANTILYVRIRTDNDGNVPPLTIRWASGAQEFSRRFDEPPPYPLEKIDVNGLALATPLWRRFSVSAADLGVVAAAPTSATALLPGEADLTGMTVHLDSGHVAVADAGALVAGQTPGDLVEDPWWRAQETAAGTSLESVGGDWTLVADGREVLPFEADYVPTFDDRVPVAQRVAEIDTALNPADATPRAVPMTVATHGMEKVLAELDAEANEADDFVDANFTRAQTNLYRIRKLILGETAAQKLLINPAIATIAEQETANATAEKLSSYIAAAKGRTVTAADANKALGIPDTAGAGSIPAAPSGLIASVARVSANTNVGSTNFLFANFVQPKLNLKAEILGVADKATALKDVFGQRAEAGPTLPPRGLSIGQRFIEPKATDNLAFARAALERLIDELPNLRLPLVGEAVLGLDTSDPTPIPLLALQGRAKPAGSKTTDQLRTDARDRLLKAPAITNATDEAEITLAALDYTETKSALLRTIEKIILARRVALQRGQETLENTRATMALAQNRVSVIGPRLAEARHDVSVARALRQEEQERIAAINEQRDTIIREQVRFLAYVRPRTIEPSRRVAAAWRLESEDAPGDVPACLALHDEPPDELRAYVQLFRSAPARWFGAIAPRLKELNTREKLVELLNATRASAIQFTAARAIPLAPARVAAAPFAALQSAYSLVEATRREAARLTVAPANTLSWAEQQKSVEQHASMGDVIEGRHGHPESARAAADELESIESVATCLHAEFAGVVPAIRLSWVERYSQFDRPSPLRDLTVLPGYAGLTRPTRRRFQALVDWLFGQVDGTQPDAVGLINDLVRICLLLASHAPVKQLIAGHVPRPTLVRPGILIPLRPLDPALVRVGMEFHVWQSNTVVAHGLVEDLRDGEVSARVNHVATATTTTTIDQTMRVQFVAPALGFAMTAGRAVS